MYKCNGGNGAVVCDQCLSNLTIVDNFDMIENILEFNSQDEFYFLQIIQRKKDGNITQIGNNGYRTIKTYYIFSKDQFLTKKEKIKELCLKNNARAYIHLNKRNAQEVALASIQQYAKLVSEGNSYQGYRVWDSACGGNRAKGYHLITIGFDVQQFNQKLAIKNMDPIDIQKDNPTLLYYATV